MLTPSRAIVIAGILIAVAIFAHALLPRYEIQHEANTPFYTRVDRWTGRVEHGDRRSGAPWLTTTQNPKP